MKKILAAVSVCVALMAPAGARDINITGDYLEVRTADVYTGPCFANAEVGLLGNEAMMAWRVREGGWQGVALTGLSVVAVVRASATLGDPYASPYPAKAVVIVDERATSGQREALVSFARSMAGDLLQDIVRVEARPIEVSFGERHGYASLQAGELASLQTRCLHEGDHLCGNEEVYYPPLTEVFHAVPVYTVGHEFQGQGLNGTWKSAGKRSAFVGEFAR